MKNEIREIAKRLLYVRPYAWPNIAISESAVRKLCMDGNQLHYCHRPRASLNWECKLFLNGGQHIVGLHRDVTALVRFADAAIVFFWKYRAQSGSRDVLPTDLNLGDVEQAKSDLVSVPVVAKILSDIESALISDGMTGREKSVSELSIPELRHKLHLHFSQLEVCIAGIHNNFTEPEYAANMAMLDQWKSEGEKFIRTWSNLLAQKQ